MTSQQPPELTPQQQSLALLRSIDASLKGILKALTANAPLPTATDQELMGRYGDQEVRFDPRDWIGPSLKGKKFSQCPPDYLDLLAKALDWFGEKDDRSGELTPKGRPKGDYKRRDAALARGWAARMRSGRMPMPKVPDGPHAATGPVDDEEAIWASGGEDEE
jgi:hypothetical protein